jgi:hypothetical protein
MCARRASALARTRLRAVTCDCLVRYCKAQSRWACCARFRSHKCSTLLEPRPVAVLHVELQIRDGVEGSRRLVRHSVPVERSSSSTQPTQYPAVMLQIGWPGFLQSLACLQSIASSQARSTQRWPAPQSVSKRHSTQPRRESQRLPSHSWPSAHVSAAGAFDFLSPLHPATVMTRATSALQGKPARTDDGNVRRGARGKTSSRGAAGDD